MVQNSWIQHFYKIFALNKQLNNVQTFPPTLKFSYYYIRSPNCYLYAVLLTYSFMKNNQ